LEGWRLLDADEIAVSWKQLRGIEVWYGGRWDDGGYYGSVSIQTYRTKLTRAELRKARGLSEEPTWVTQALTDLDEFERISRESKTLIRASASDAEVEKLRHAKEYLEKENSELREERDQAALLASQAEMRRANKAEANYAEEARLHALTKGELAALTEFERDRARGYEDGYMKQAKEIAALRSLWRGAMEGEGRALVANEELHKERDRLAAENARLRALLGMETPWPLHDTLNKLAEGIDLLFERYGYDSDGWEAISSACIRAREVSAALEGGQP
jgi:hypothetical protein